MQCIAKPGQAEQTINKSRFIAVAEYCGDERSVSLCLSRLASANHGAHHLAFAFRLQTAHGIVQRFHDAGEPSGTAGKPILQFIEGRDLINICVGVVRYYGGINLGTGGLARAYGGTAKLALEAANITPFIEMREIGLVIDYAQFDACCRELVKLGGTLIDKQFGERVKVIVSLPADQAAAFIQRYQ
ncbi:MAG TPA: YigZ family protein [Methylophilaceae bacterium]|nr:YigZ family protein [Methylophilaceae bacterium]